MGLSSRDVQVTEQQVLNALSQVQEPELGGDLVSRRMIKDVQVDGGRVSFTVELTTPACPLKDQIRAEAEAAVAAVPGVETVLLEFSANTRQHAGLPEQAPIPGVSNVLAVAAGKGGVGKSTVAVNLAVALAQEGASVGLLDADVFGPSLPLMLGINGQPQAVQNEQGKAMILPLEGHGIKLMSVGFMIDENQPVIWRGPMASQLLRQFLYDVAWAPLDYLIIDMPPGTSDIALTLAQSLPLTGSLIVTTPQAVATTDVIKAMEMLKKVNVPLLGIVENMAYFVAPDTGTRYDIFGSGGAERLSTQLGVPLLGQIPLGMAVRAGGDSGNPAVSNAAPDAYAETFRQVARQLAARISVLKFVQ
ncbi:Mrp/NBP35 family ATP-binding protein [Candidatus Viridilinea mediisalina]|uniref:Iron-sulfur cluster carrier protein n=1 Tax=Candidatus Viridilinea mediisalina TaxID=2024553 RepID=A0A2A6RFI1_9CHLR|nr:Mrp/NBP35 family ATP-binding protein [Candidatus Viridilinea mediisalina]PDW01691.1 chromosome partitioning protein [Candidatus Viridilinea mediisalina]